MSSPGKPRMEPLEAANMDIPPPRRGDTVEFRSLDAPGPSAAAPKRLPHLRKPGNAAIFVALTASAFWMGAVGAFSWGYFGPYELGRMALHWKLLIVAGMTIPPLLMWLAALIVRRAEALRITTEDLSLIAWRLTQPEDSAAREITRVGRAVRREIDALNTGLENALSRVRALEETMTERTAEIERTTAEVAERVDHVRYRLRDERERLSELSLSLRGEAERIGEVLSGRVALVRTAAEGAAEELREAQKVIDNQIESFKTAAAAAAEGSKLAGKEIEREAARFEATAESALARAESLQQRHERQRGALQDAVERLRQEGEAIEGALERQRNNLDRIADAMAAQTQRIDAAASDGGRRIDAVAANFLARMEQMGSQIAREADRAKTSGELTNASLEETGRAVQDIVERARTTIAAETADATRHLDDVMAAAAEASTRLSQTMSDVKTAATEAFSAIDGAAERMRRMMDNLPGEAGEHAQRVRAILEQEVNALLTLSDKMNAAAKVAARKVERVEADNAAPPPAPSARAAGTVPPPAPAERTEPVLRRQSTPFATKAMATPAAAPMDEDRVEPNADPDGAKGHGWLEFARRLAGREKKDADLGPAPWRISTVLAAADKAHAEGPATERARLQAMSLRVMEALDALPIDLDRALETEQPLELWRRFAAGDRNAFAKRLVGVLTRDERERIAQRYASDPAFKDLSDRYLRQFDALIEEGVQSDRDRIMTETYLASQVGKVYLILAHALGRVAG